MYQGGVCEIGKRIYNINGTTFVDWYDGNNSNYVNLLQFLQDNPLDYPNPQLYNFGNSSNSNSLGL